MKKYRNFVFLQAWVTLVAMRDLFVRLFLVIAIAFAPVGNAISDVSIDDMGSSMHMDDCTDCKHHHNHAPGGCGSSDCFVHTCAASSSAPVFGLQHVPPGTVRLDLPVHGKTCAQKPYLSQTPIPLFRPPIA